MAEKKSARIDLWVPPHMKLTLELLAERDRRKLSAFICIVLEQYIENCAVQRDAGQESE